MISLDFYTGLPNITIVKCIFEHSSKGLSQEGGNKLALFKNLCILMKLRTNAVINDLVYQFNVSNARILLSSWMSG